jgi:hypothetical protein
VQLALLKLPVPLLEKLTVPVGVLLVPPSVSATVAVQVDAIPISTDVGEQLTVAEVVRVFTVTVGLDAIAASVLPEVFPDRVCVVNGLEPVVAGDAASP